MTLKKDLSISILEEIQSLTGIEFIVYRSSVSTTHRISGIGSIHPDKNYGEFGDFMNQTIKWGRPIFVEEFSQLEMSPFESNDFTLINSEKLSSIYSVPLIYSQTVLGSLLFGSRSKYILTEDKEKIFSSIIRMLSIYLENKNLYRQIENQATISERKRISGEIHDGLAQSIGFINIQLHRLKKMIKNNELEKAMQEIEAASEAVQDSYVELREAIDQLRDINGYNESFGEWMWKYTQDFQVTYGIHVFVDHSSFDKIQLTDEQMVQLTRVFQEIFNNIRKHSEAKNVWLNCIHKENSLVLSIEDDGIGFDPSMNYKRKYNNAMHVKMDKLHNKPDMLVRQLHKLTNEDVYEDYVPSGLTNETEIKKWRNKPFRNLHKENVYEVRKKIIKGNTKGIINPETSYLSQWQYIDNYGKFEFLGDTYQLDVNRVKNYKPCTVTKGTGINKRDNGMSMDKILICALCEDTFETIELQPGVQISKPKKEVKQIYFYDMNVEQINSKLINKYNISY
jgi:two-component sensor histidine kinase